MRFALAFVIALGVALPAQATPPERYRVELGQAPLRGAPEALVTIVVWSDFECPFCGRVEPTLARLVAAFPGQVRVAWKDQPLPFHERARGAAIAARAAGRQGKFWPMHDAIFADGVGRLAPADHERRARQLGLDLQRFRRDLADEALGGAVDADAAQGLALGATGTPTSFVNGRAVRGAQPYEVFAAVVAEELAHARALVKSGVAPAALYARVIKDGRAAPPPPPPPPPPPEEDRTLWNVPVQGAPAMGPATAAVTLVVWNDYQCPFCARHAGALKELRFDLGQDLRVVHRDQPLPFHKDARLAAVAARAAGAQGRYFDMHDKLFANQRALDRASLETYALELGLDMARFRAALDDPRLLAAVEADARAGEALGARGTPTTFINGRRVVGAVPLDVLRAIIEQELTRAKAALKKGVRADRLYETLVKDGKTEESR